MPAGGQPKPSEYAVEAAYLLNFGKFMRVSPGAEAGAGSFNICVVGKDSLGPSLDEIAANEVLEGRPVRVVRLEQAQAQPQPRQCDIAYFDASEQRRIEQDLALLHGSDTLTVSDAPDFLKHGGMIQLQLVSNHVRFSVNLEAVRRTHLVLSSELLRVAVSVTGNNPGEVQP
jgi:YfiR/HmsC-like